MNWNGDADRLLIELWMKGLTMGGMAEAMTAAGHQVESRSAISGRINRLRRQGVELTAREPHRFTPKPPREKPPRKANGITHNNGVDYLSNHDGCKAILDTRSGRYNLHKCCGKSREPGTPYCAGHLRAYLNLPAARK